MDRVRIKLHPLGKVCSAKKGAPLKDVLHESGVEFPCGGKGTCGKCAVRLLEGSVSKDAFHQEQLDRLGLDKSWCLSCLSYCEEDLVLEVEQFETLIQADETEFEFRPKEGYGLAVDLGTTTIVAQLVDLQTGFILGLETDLNPQKDYGADLVTRLEYALEHSSHELRDLVRNKVGQMLSGLCAGRGVNPETVVIVGNTVMHHLFCDLDIRPLSFYPFESTKLDMVEFTSSDLGWDIRCDRITFYPSIGSFVGSDILAGILATGMHQSEEISVLIDLGTNGEIVAGNRERLLCASTAAGPAFEGARISKGMIAATGAIASVESLGEPPVFRVIGEVEARGICGSGLIDAVGVLIREKQIGSYGEILSGADGIDISSGIALTQKDIQEFQLAKAAIAAGVEILLRKLQLTKEDVSEVYIAGAFGKYINLEHVVGTGMLDFPVEKMHQPGNTAILGARMLLYSGEAWAREILAKSSHVNLESDKDFQDLYISCMMLES